MKAKTLLWILLASFPVSLTANVQASTSVDSIIKKANLAAYYQGDDGKAQARMLIVDNQGNKQIRQFTILRKDTTDIAEQDFLVFFSKPSDVKGTVFRVGKKVTAEDDRWLYLPALDLVKRISAGDKRTSFVGSHYFYEDISGRNIAEDNFELVYSNNEYYQLEAKPKNPQSVEFSHYHIFIDKKTFLPHKATYFASNGKALREMQVLKVADIQGIPTVMHAKMTNLLDNSYTEIKFRRVSYDIGLPDSIFSERSLRTPPKKWLKK